MSIGIRVVLVDENGKTDDTFWCHQAADLTHHANPSDALADAAEKAGKAFARWILRNCADIDERYGEAKAAADGAYYDAIEKVWKR